MAETGKGPDNRAGGRRGAARCPICGARPAARYRPFCSERCANVDLGRWLKGVYRIPTDDEPGEGEAGPEEGG